MRTYVSRAVFLFLLPFATVLAGSYWLINCSYASSQVTRARCRREVACSIAMVRPEGYRVRLGFPCVLRHLPSPDAWHFYLCLSVFVSRLGPTGLSAEGGSGSLTTNTPLPVRSDS